jgi:hypothetical protein
MAKSTASPPSAFGFGTALTTLHVNAADKKKRFKSMV